MRYGVQVRRDGGTGLVGTGHSAVAKKCTVVVRSGCGRGRLFGKYSRLP